MYVRVSTLSVEKRMMFLYIEDRDSSAEETLEGAKLLRQRQRQRQWARRCRSVDQMDGLLWMDLLFHKTRLYVLIQICLLAYLSFYGTVSVPHCLSASLSFAPRLLFNFL